MAPLDVLLKPEACVMLLIDFQAGLGFGVESIPRRGRSYSYHRKLPTCWRP
jgi:hypothetical protein